MGESKEITTVFSHKVETGIDSGLALVKYECRKCKGKWYDYGVPLICPNCGVKFKPNDLSKRNLAQESGIRINNNVNGRYIARILSGGNNVIRNGLIYYVEVYDNEVHIFNNYKYEHKVSTSLYITDVELLIDKKIDDFKKVHANCYGECALVEQQCKNPHNKILKIINKYSRNNYERDAFIEELLY